MLIDAIYDLVGGSDPVSVLQSVVFALVAIVVALTLHEFAHAAVASLCGDKTSKAQGRLSLNPLNHIDPVGFLMLFVFAPRMRADCGGRSSLQPFAGVYICFSRIPTLG